MKRDIWVYVAGPYTRPDPAVNVRNAVLTGLRLRALGFVPIIPHLSHLMHLIEPHAYQFWMDWDFAWLKRCDALVVLQGESPGARLEEEGAYALGIPVFNIGPADNIDFDDLLAWEEKRRYWLDNADDPIFAAIDTVAINVGFDDRVRRADLRRLAEELAWSRDQAENRALAAHEARRMSEARNDELQAELNAALTRVSPEESANLTEIERVALREAVVTFREHLQQNGYRGATTPSIGRDRAGELFYAFAVQRPDGLLVTFRLTLTTPHGS